MRPAPAVEPPDLPHLPDRRFPIHVMDSPLTGTEEFLYQKIPLSRAMGIRVLQHEGEGIVLTAPLEANHNHLGTAFGGSISAIATLAGYALLWLALGDHSAHILIRRSSISYENPIRENLHAICKTPTPETLAAFLARFHKAGKARISLIVEFTENGRICATYEGEYVALK